MSTIEKLKPKAREVFDKYVELRSLWKVGKELGLEHGAVYGYYGTTVFQTALKEYNEALVDRVNYNSAVIIDELWKEYNCIEPGSKGRTEILVLLGKAIGMWSTQTKDNSKPNIQYNIIHYEVEKNKEEVEKVVKEQENDTPIGFKVLEFNE